MEQPSSPVNTGNIFKVTLGVSNYYVPPALGFKTYTSSFRVDFEIISGQAQLLGGDGETLQGKRYDISGSSGTMGIATMYVKVEDGYTGDVIVDAKIEGCGNYQWDNAANAYKGDDRWCHETVIMTDENGVLEQINIIIDPE